MPLQPPARPFTTAARVYPSLPTFSSQSSSRTPLNQATSKLSKAGKWAVPALAVIAVGYAAANMVEERHYDAANYTSAVQPARTQQQKNEALMEAFGDRMSLQDLEKALETYEVK